MTTVESKPEPPVTSDPSTPQNTNENEEEHGPHKYNAKAVPSKGILKKPGESDPKKKRASVRITGDEAEEVKKQANKAKKDLPIEGYHGLVHKGAKKKTASSSSSASASEAKNDTEVSAVSDPKIGDKKSQPENETTKTDAPKTPSGQFKPVDSGDKDKEKDKEKEKEEKEKEKGKEKDKEKEKEEIEKEKGKEKDKEKEKEEKEKEKGKEKDKEKEKKPPVSSDKPAKEGKEKKDKDCLVM
jgi:hypothetical protein